MRQLENQFLAVPPELARTFPRSLRQLIVHRSHGFLGSAVREAGTADQLRRASSQGEPVRVQVDAWGVAHRRATHGSRVDALQQQHMAMARRERTEVQLQQIPSAIARLDAGSYGACVSCDEPIGYGRLKARPESPLCRDCQQVRR